MRWHGLLWCWTQNKLAYYDGRDRSCGCPWHYQGQGGAWMLDRLLDVRYGFHTNLYWYGLLPHHRTTDWWPFLCLILLPFTQCPFRVSDERLVIPYTRRFSAAWNTGLNHSHEPVFIFLVWNLLIHFHSNGIWLQQYSLFCFTPKKTCPLSLTDTSLSFLFILSHFISNCFAFARHNYNMMVKVTSKSSEKWRLKYIETLC